MPDIHAPTPIEVGAVTSTVGEGSGLAGLASRRAARRTDAVTAVTAATP
jgi:hypothetical protein